jgi:hypothetical protein
LKAQILKTWEGVFSVNCYPFKSKDEAVDFIKALKEMGFIPGEKE